MAKQQTITPATEATAKTVPGIRAAGSKAAPGPRCGNLLLGSAAALQRAPLKFPLELARDYGPIVHVRILFYSTLLIFHPDALQHVLKTKHQNYDRNLLMYAVMRHFFGEGLATVSGPNHLRHRRMMQPFFLRAHLTTFGTLMTNATSDMLEDWQAVANQGQPLEIHEEMTRLTLRILGLCLFHLDLTAEANEIGQAVTSLLAELADYVFVPFPPLSVPSPRNRRMQATQKMLNRFVQNLIDDRRKSDAAQDDLLSMLLLAQDEESGSKMSDQQVRDEILTLLFAGSEAPSHTLAFALYLLSQHPEVEMRLYSEVHTVLGNQTPTVEHLKALPYLRRVVEETLRLFPAGGTLPRRAKADDDICGFSVRKHSLVFFNPYVTHRLEEFWPEPERFDPDRFAPERVAVRHPYAYLPFGAGPHLCLGRDFAMMEIQFALAMILQRFRLRLLPGQRIEPKATIIIRPNSGINMMLHPREQVQGSAAR